MSATSKLKLWIRSLTVLFALSLLGNLWMAFSNRNVAESWIYHHGESFKINGNTITNSSPDTGIWVDSRHYAHRDVTKFDAATILSWLICGIPIVMINYYARTYSRDGIARHCGGQQSRAQQVADGKTPEASQSPH